MMTVHRSVAAILGGTPVGHLQIHSSEQGIFDDGIPLFWALHSISPQSVNPTLRDAPKMTPFCLRDPFTSRRSVAGAQNICTES